MTSTGALAAPRNVKISIPLVCLAVLALLALAGCDNDRDGDSGGAPRKAKDKTAPAAAEKVAPNECRWADGPITIDGVADEPAWKNAQVVDNFYLPWLKDKARPSRTKTTARLLWDRDFVYFHADMEDTDIYASVKEHDGPTWNDDVFEIFFKPADDKPGYYEFEFSAANTTMDLFIPRRHTGGYDRYKADRPFNMTTAVKLRGTLNNWADKDEGWSVEGKIPWRDFLPTGGRPADDEVWNFAFCRGDTSVDTEGVELSTSAPLKSLPYADFHHYEDYAKIKFVGPQKSASSKPFGIEKRLAWNDSRVVGSPEPPLPFKVKRVYEKLNVAYPIHVFHEPGTKNLILLHQTWAWGGPGEMLRIADDPNVDKYETLLVPNRLMYGCAFDKDFEKNGWIYVGSNGPMDGKEKDKTTRVSRYTIDRTTQKLDPKSEFIVIEWQSDGHNGGDLGFGPDGMLYVTSGDGTSDSDGNLRGQNLAELTSKMLRIDITPCRENKPYVVPKDNPFVGKPDVRPETWAYGFRNPWRMTFDAKTGHLWVGQNGQDLWEQVIFVRKGENYGWSVQEGGHPFYPDRKRGPEPITPPTIDHPHSEARSLTGGQVYYGSEFPELRGMYIYGDFSTGKIWAARHDGTKLVEHKQIADSTMKITGFGFDSRGELLIADHNTGYFKLEHNTTQSKPEDFPHLLSETGVFSSVKGHVPHAAAIPYDVNAQLWSDGAYKERFFLLPGGESKVDYTGDRGWEFPEGAVMVKSFALEREAGNPASRQWIETRLLTKTNGKWVGYSYEWNEAQTDAKLVKGEGVDKDFSIRDTAAGGGVRKQTWHYPSRTECMVCHSRAFNFVLGTTELQMNRERKYENGVVDNQLRTLEHLGIFKAKWVDFERQKMYHELKEKNNLPEDKTWEDVNKITATRLQREPVFSSVLPRNPEAADKLVNPYDEKADLTLRARSYLHANCAICHVMAGGGNAAMELDFKTKPESTNILDAKPMHSTFDLKDAKLISPGAPESSVLLHRISMRERGQMPPLASAVVDQNAVKLMREWIASLPKK
jgi:uncharacterized repeat protein (TIGR03806 family)